MNIQHEIQGNQEMKLNNPKKKKVQSRDIPAHFCLLILPHFDFLPLKFLDGYFTFGAKLSIRMSKGGQPLGRLNNAIFNRDNSQFQGGPSHGNPQSSSAHEAQYSAFIGSSNATTMDNNMPLLPDASMIGPPPLGMEKNGWHGDFEAFHHDQTQMNQSSRQMNQWSNEFHVAPVNNAPVYAPTPFIGPRFHSSAVAVPMTGKICIYFHEF